MGATSDGDRGAPGQASAGAAHRLDVAQRRREKAAARGQDAEDLRTGRKSAEQLTDENSMFPRGLLKRARVIFPEQE